MEVGGSFSSIVLKGPFRLARLLFLFFFLTDSSSEQGEDGKSDLHPAIVEAFSSFPECLYPIQSPIRFQRSQRYQTVPPFLFSLVNLVETQNCL